MNAIVDDAIAPAVSTMRSHIVSMSPDFCMLSPKDWSIKNSKISQTAPIAIAKENEKIAIMRGLALTSRLEYMRYSIEKPMNPKTIAEPPWRRVSHHANLS